MQRRSPKLNVLYLSAEQFMYRFVQALRERKMMDFKQLFRSVDVLMVDDVQFIAGKDSTQEEFFHTFNALVDQNKQIIISARPRPGRDQGSEERIKSRLQCGLVVDLHPTITNCAWAFCNPKSNFSSQYPELSNCDGRAGIPCPPHFDQRACAGRRVDPSVCLCVACWPRNHMELTQDCLADVLRASDRKITVEEIQRKVSDHYNIRLSDMIGPNACASMPVPARWRCIWPSS